MEEFLRQNSSLVIRVIEIIAAVTGLLLYKKYKQTAAKFFIYFLIYLSLCEVFGLYANYTTGNGFLNFLEGTKYEKNYWWYNLTWSIGAILFFVFYYRKIYKNKLYKKIVTYSGVIFFLISIIYLLFNFQELFKSSLHLIKVTGAIVILLCTVLYFIQILQNEDILTFYKSLNFYVSTAILIWWLIITPIVFFNIYFGVRDWEFVFLKREIYLFCNLFMYSMFTFGLIFSNPNND